MWERHPATQQLRDQLTEAEIDCIAVTGLYEVVYQETSSLGVGITLLHIWTRLEDMEVEVVVRDVQLFARESELTVVLRKRDGMIGALGRSIGISEFNMVSIDVVESTAGGFDTTNGIIHVVAAADGNGVTSDNHTNHIVDLHVDSVQEVVISESLCRLRFLKSLFVTGDTSRVTGTLPPCLWNLSYIQNLELPGNELSGMIPSSICFLTRLTYLDLSYNKLDGNIPSCMGNLSSLTHIDFYINHLSGSIPPSLGNISSLDYLGLAKNQLSRNIPISIGSLFLLTSLLLGENPLSGKIPNSLGNLTLLEFFDLEDTQLSGTIPPSFAHLCSLTHFYVGGNRFNETVAASSLPLSFGNLSLSLSHNQSISETFFHNLTGLYSLYLSNCVINISTSWIPSFQLGQRSLVSCTICHGEFPAWISTQFSLHTLELVNSGLVGDIPSWLWETSPLLAYLNLSGNHLEGNILSNTSTWMQLEMLDLSRNGFSGHIPTIWSPSSHLLLLNDNFFSGNIPPSLGSLCNIPSCLGRLSHPDEDYFSDNNPPGLELLNLANNYLTGVIPMSLFNSSFLSVLNLANNSLEGSLPNEFNKLSELYSVVVHSNNLNGSFPLSIATCLKLQVLDIGNNLLGGEIPKVICKSFRAKSIGDEGKQFCRQDSSKDWAVKEPSDCAPLFQSYFRFNSTHNCIIASNGQYKSRWFCIVCF
ncbi:LRR receptor-like serine/threonine-protein kinase FLS2 [Cryptomeria japonica]|uniref:LRR receptor-like serine/threonine-protein kinase FLS2 n=1 Tax=Cryptomeria japonica TaxID=3369 RepID=UPI0027DA6D81|nr:LRR receptor-like serine/threonine-protein kinase FLS2 [Cryptomeria japonica]